jgi:Peptidase A4 family
MKPLRQISVPLLRATHTSSNAHVFESSSPSRENRRLLGVFTALLGIAVAVVLLPSSARAGAPASKQTDASTVARARAAFLKTMSSHRPMVRSGMKPLAANGNTSSAASVNWSGYADLEGGANTISSVSGQWQIPKVECPNGLYRNQDAFIAQWVGIDGAINGTVEQLGSATQCFEGVTYYYVWYEMFPAGTVEEGTLACINNNVDCPQPGDQISASVTVTAGGNYTLSLTDSTRPQESFSVTASCDPSICLDQSAEWIVERPAFALPFGFQILPLSDFFQASFVNGGVTSGGKATKIEGFQDGPVLDIAMLDDTDSYFLDCVGQKGAPGQLLQATDPTVCPTVTPSQGSFNVTWDGSF